MAAMTEHTPHPRDPVTDAETILSLRREVVKLREMMNCSFGGPGFVVYGTAASIENVRARVLDPENEELAEELESLAELDFNSDCCNSRFPINAVRRVMLAAAARLKPSAS